MPFGGVYGWMVSCTGEPHSLADLNDPRWAETVMGGDPRLVALMSAARGFTGMGHGRVFGVVPYRMFVN